ncbi:MAG: hypothetical protein L6R42_007904 [Xanthoria sp. 1 TBL-2021]|nr:MAG: hypothetical protein L6R42_007904 [Xanthoria sp. 1 TBL-2021]
MEIDVASEYGSDFTPDEEEILQSLLLQAPAARLTDDHGLVLKDIEDNESLRGARVPRINTSHEQRLSGGSQIIDPKQASRYTVEMADDSKLPASVESPESRDGRDRHERSVSIEGHVDIPPVASKPGEPDLRSPLERFRSKPRKPLSVTDLVSPSWCELQYWFTLTKHGKKRRTPAMKQGTAVHKVLEEEVHRTVAINIRTREDAWGLRIWNTIQGLRTLRKTGLTRELEVWGVFDGLVVNGVIDELSYECPDPELEVVVLQTTNITPSLPPDQRSIADFLSPKASQDLNQTNFGAVAASPPQCVPTKKDSSIYITDTKTRSVNSIPKAASFRPTLMQLMLYHRLLSNMATNKIDASALFSRHDLQSDEPFTDAFIAQISGIFSNIPPSTSQTTNSPEDPPPSSPEIDQDTLNLLLAHNSLNQLWTLMMRDFQTTFPHGAQSVGKVLKADYRNALDGHVIGEKTLLMDEALLTKYLESELKWWKGERAAEGVCLEEAYKCGSCEFADECGWRKGKIEEAREKMRMRRDGSRSLV